MGARAARQPSSTGQNRQRCKGFQTANAHTGSVQQSGVLSCLLGGIHGVNERYRSLKVNIMQGAVRAVSRSAEATVAAAGAVGGAALNGVIGGAQGAVNGIKSGASSGSHSTAAAAVTLAAIGATGLVEWPVLVGVGATALVVRRLAQRGENEPPPPTLRAVPDSSTTNRPAAKRNSARKATKTTKATKAPARKSAARRSTASKR